jgi:hypothetical protein
MTIALESAPESGLAAPAFAASLNPAIARCCEAWTQTFDDRTAMGLSSPEYHAHKSYRQAMPPLSGAENIRDFIACTAHGMLIGAIASDDGARLLYAAQVARGALPSQSAAKKTPKS